MTQARGGLLFLVLFGLWTVASLAAMFAQANGRSGGLSPAFSAVAWIVLLGVPVLLAGLTWVFFFLLSGVCTPASRRRFAGKRRASD